MGSQNSCCRSKSGCRRAVLRLKLDKNDNTLTCITLAITHIPVITYCEVESIELGRLLASTEGTMANTCRSGESGAKGRNEVNPSPRRLIVVWIPQHSMRRPPNSVGRDTMGATAVAAWWEVIIRVDARQNRRSSAVWRLETCPHDCRLLFQDPCIWWIYPQIV